MGGSVFKMGLACHSGYRQAAPGQFVMLRISRRPFPLLRRPFSIHGLIPAQDGPGGIEILYKVVGESTRYLSGCRTGETLDMLGPLGKGFKIPGDLQRVVIVAGGIGIAPMRFLAAALIDRGVKASASRVLIGGKSKADILCADEFSNLGMCTRLATEDGSAGVEGVVTLLLKEETGKNPPDMIYACGPVGMLKQVVALAEKHRLSCQLSIETMMACGMGACLGCAVENRSQPEKYLHACLDGPVFDADEVGL